MGVVHGRLAQAPVLAGQKAATDPSVLASISTETHLQVIDLSRSGRHHHYTFADWGTGCYFQKLRSHPASPAEKIDWSGDVDLVAVNRDGQGLPIMTLTRVERNGNCRHRSVNNQYWNVLGGQIYFSRVTLRFPHPGSM